MLWDSDRPWSLRLDDGTTFKVVERSVVATREVTERARMESAVKPDQAWSYIDAAVHEHTWLGRTLPTLERRSRHIPCDGSCGGVCEGEGYYVPEYVCPRCGEVVEPGHVPDWQARGEGLPITGERRVTFKVKGGVALVELARRLHGPEVLSNGMVTLRATMPYMPITDAMLVRASADDDAAEERWPLPPLRALGELIHGSSDGPVEVEVEASELVNLVPAPEDDTR